MGGREGGGKTVKRNAILFRGQSRCDGDAVEGGTANAAALRRTSASFSDGFHLNLSKGIHPHT
jgi:hypothetical protein